MQTHLENEHSSALTNNKSIPPLIKRAACEVRRFVERSAETACPRKTADCERMDAAFGGAGDHNIRFSTGNHASCVADCVCTRSTCGSGRGIRSLRTKAHGDVPSRKIDQQPWDEEGADCSVAVSVKCNGRVVCIFEATDSRSDADALVQWSVSSVIIDSALTKIHMDIDEGQGSQGRPDPLRRTKFSLSSCDCAS